MDCNTAQEFVWKCLWSKIDGDDKIWHVILLMFFSHYMIMVCCSHGKKHRWMSLRSEWRFVLTWLAYQPTPTVLYPSWQNHLREDSGDPQRHTVSKHLNQVSHNFTRAFLKYLKRLWYLIVIPIVPLFFIIVSSSVCRLWLCPWFTVKTLYIIILIYTRNVV